MQKWEYTEVYTKGNNPSIEYTREILYINGVPQKEGFPFDHNYISDLGNYGWELVTKDGHFYIFKRPKE